MSQIGIILFDMGNVLVHIDFGAFWKNLGFLRPEEIIPYTDDYKLLTLNYESGKIPTETYLKSLQAALNNRFTTEKIEEAFASIIQQPVEGMAEIVRRISVRYQLGLVSNTNEIHYKYASENIGFLRDITHHYLSYQIRAMKPTRLFFDTIVKDLKAYPSKMLIIDDLQDIIKEAKMAGLQGIRFEDAAKLEVNLKTLGVL
jgi:glucose-1-phosphatase